MHQSAREFEHYSWSTNHHRQMRCTGMQWGGGGRATLTKSRLQRKRHEICLHLRGGMGERVVKAKAISNWTAHNVNADAYRHHEIKIDDDLNVVTFLQTSCCTNCQIIPRQDSTENRGVNQSNQQKWKPYVYLTRNHLHSYTEIASLSRTKNNQVQLST